MRGWLVGAVLGIAGAVASVPATARTYALVIGIDDYQHIRPLGGAVNDARDIVDALLALPDAEVQLLLDGQATRVRIIESWRAMAAKVQPGDTLIVTYAGHGSYETEAIPGSERDGRDENLLLSGFDFDGPNAAERIRDDEIAALLRLTPANQVILLIDACHAGTMTRSGDHRLGTRFSPPRPMRSDPLPPPPPPPAGATSYDLADNTFFIGAVDEGLEVPEILIGDEVRGALSYAFADAVRGVADLDRDNVLSKGEIERHVRSLVKARTEGAQRPQVEPEGFADVAVLALDPTGAVEPPPPQNAFMLGFEALPPVAVGASGVADPGAFLAGLSGVRAIPADTEQGYVIDFAQGVIRSDFGDTVFRLPSNHPVRDLPAIQQVADKMRMIEALKSARGANTLDVSFSTGSGLYRPGSPVGLRVAGRASNLITVFNLASDGTIARIYPDPNFGDPETVEAWNTLDLGIEATPPFGADHMVAIETYDAATTGALRRALNRHDLSQDVRAFWTDLHFGLAGAPSAVAVFPFFTAP